MDSANYLLQKLHELYEPIGLGDTLDTLAVRATAFVLVVLIAWIANVIARRYLLAAVQAFAKRTTTKWDDALVERRVFRSAAHVAPAAVIWLLAPLAFDGYDVLIAYARKVVEVYLIVLTLVVVHRLLDAVNQIYNEDFEIAKKVPIKSYLQVAEILFVIASLILALSVLFEKSPWVYLSGLGAATAILLLIFRDSILGLVAGIQLVMNDMVRPGDWIEMPKYGADGDVLEVSLTTVKVRNWDKTITTIPTYALISDSFKNWRGMSESGGRRIKRSFALDVTSIQFCSEDLIDRLEKIDLLKEYVAEKRSELAEYNSENVVEDGVPANGRRMTNIGTFRAYLERYLRQHPKIHKDMTFLVRQLAPTDHGLPLEVYVFSNDQKWANYEAIQADIFDHLYAVLPYFELRAYQEPSSYDVVASANTAGAAV